jgi:8-amino-7-oxononanoate synthase
MYDLEEQLAQLEQRGLRRRLRLISGPQGPRVLLDGKPALLLCSNNYLGLADHPRVREAAAEGARRWGVGAGASRLVSGSMTIHRRLEERLAAFEGTQSCLLFGSGYLANTGTIAALAGPDDVIFSDQLNHASIVDGCRLSRARTVVYRHADAEHLAHCLAGEQCAGERVIVTDTVFSMDGDIAPLQEIVELAERFEARLIVDEAHATGALGPGGRGALAEAGLEGQADVVIGTLGKALGSYGAYACADEPTIQYLINHARPFIFSTAPAPPAVAGALAALELLEERPHRVERLRAAARLLRNSLIKAGFAVQSSQMHIIPLLIGEERPALALSRAASERGIFVQAIRPPSVPPGTTRLRLTVMASHTPAELQSAAQALGRLAKSLGLEPEQIGEHAQEELTSARESPRTAAGARQRQSIEQDTAAYELPEQPFAAMPPSAPFDVEREGLRREAA